MRRNNSNSTALTLALILGSAGATPAAPAPASIALPSPSGTLTAEVAMLGDGTLAWSLHRGAVALIPPSPLGITVDGQDLARSVTFGEPTVALLEERYPWRGVKNTATNRCRIVRLPLRHPATGQAWELETRTFDDGFAYRYRVPGQGRRTVQGERSGWSLPKDAVVWYQTNTRNYEGVYQSAPADQIPTETPTDQGPQPIFLGPPVTVELPDGNRLLITEANLVNYSGMTLRPSPTGRLTATFEDDPQGFALDGEIVSPWRVTVAVTDLDALVNTDLIHNLCPPPDPQLFPHGTATPWIRPGRALITWCVFGNDGAQWHLQKWFVDQCAALDCEYLLVDGGWRTERWGYLAEGGDLWARLREICDYAATRNVGIIVWHAFPEGRDDGPGLTQPDARREFFRRCREAGVKGVKIDFFDSEKQSVIAAYTDLARLAAEHQLMINFHGANKPTGEVRTWPNAITREGIREQEYLLWEQLPRAHYAALPFTRMVVGPSDFLPTYVRPKYLKNTTATAQMATAILATSPFLCWPDHPDDYRASPFLGLVQALPVDWDETRVLPGSAIGQAVAFARRKGPTWFVGAFNAGDSPRSWDLPLAFLGKGSFTATLYRDADPTPEGVHVEVGQEFKVTDTLNFSTPGGGGFVAWLRPTVKP